MKYSQQAKGIIALILLSFGFACIAISVRYLGTTYSLLQQLYITLGVAFLFSLLFFPTSLPITKLRLIPIKDWAVIFFRVIFGYLFGASLYRESLELTKISNVTFIQSIPFAGLFGFILFKEKFSFKKLLLLLLAYVGILMIFIKDYSSVPTFGKGELFSFISAALFSLSFLSRKWQSDVLTNQEITQILLFLGTIILFVVSIIFGESLPTFHLEPMLLLAIIFTGFFNTINIFLINYGFKNVKAVLANNILTLEGVFALALAFMFYKELPNLKELLGGMLIIGSVILMERVEEK